MWCLKQKPRFKFSWMPLWDWDWYLFLVWAVRICASCSGPREEEMSGLGKAERFQQTKRTFSTGANKGSARVCVPKRDQTPFCAFNDSPPVALVCRIREFWAWSLENYEWEAIQRYYPLCLSLLWMRGKSLLTSRSLPGICDAVLSQNCIILYVTFHVDISQRDWFNVHVCTGNSMQKGKPKALRNNVGEIANVNPGSRKSHSPPSPLGVGKNISAPIWCWCKFHLARQRSSLWPERS